MGNPPASRIVCVVDALVGVLFPPLCYSCGCLLPPGHRIACSACVAAMPPIDSTDLLFHVARDRLRAGGVIDDLVSLFRFEKGSELQTLLHQLKYGGAAGIGSWLGERLGRIVLETTTIRQFDGIIPVPLHIARKRERGYNQSEQIAKGIARIVRLPVNPELVERTRHTATQTALDTEERRLNMEDAFTVPGKRSGDIEKRVYLLVDDVITTGATMRSCARALRLAGAQRIIACSVGLADRTGLSDLLSGPLS